METFNITPHGLSLGQGTFKSAMIFKDKKEVEVLPIWLGSNEANILVQGAQLNPREGSVHAATLKIFEALGIVLQSVYFNEISNNTQYAEILAVQGGQKLRVRLRAQDALPLALQMGCTFQTNQEIVEKSRTLNFNYQVMNPSLPELVSEKKDASHLH